MTKYNASLCIELLISAIIITYKNKEHPESTNSAKAVALSLCSYCMSYKMTYLIRPQQRRPLVNDDISSTYLYLTVLSEVNKRSK